MKVCILGSNGYIGSNLSKFLIASGHEVDGYSSKSSGFFSATGLLEPSFKLTKKYDSVFYFSQSPHYRSTDQLDHLHNVNVASAYKSAQLAKEAGCKRFFYASTGNIYAPNFNAVNESSEILKADPYSTSKILGEQAVSECSGIQTSSLRLFGIFGPGQYQRIIYNLIDRISKGQAVEIQPKFLNERFPTGLTLSFLYIKDLVQILMKLSSAESIPKSLNVAGPAAINVVEASKTIAGLLSEKAHFIEVSNVRKTDYIADISKMLKVCPFEFSQFEEAVLATIKDYQEQFLK